MKLPDNCFMQDPLFRKRILIMGIALTALFVGNMTQYQYDPSRWMTYRDFDVPGEKNFINYLSPGVKDVSTGTSYDFSRKNWGLLAGILLGFFPVMLFLRAAGDVDLKIGVYRFLTQWLTFVIARAGILRVAGICPVKRSGLGVFPFMNCQSCELATGACPLGTFQMSLVNKQLPLALIGQTLLVGLISGRWVCGWLCPFGFLSDIFGRLPGKRKKLPLWAGWAKYAFLALFLGSSLTYLFRENTKALFFCSFLCPVGFYYGVLEYALTTGLHAMIEEFPYFHFMFLYHCFIAALFIFGTIKLGGRFYCKYICPLGTIYGLFNKIALIRLTANKNKCTGCGECDKVCPMRISVRSQSHLNRSSCILCGRCVKVCPAGKLRLTTDLFSGRAASPIPAVVAAAPKPRRKP